MDYRLSNKTKHPACCNWGCCGNNFGRVEKSFKKDGRIYYPKHRMNKMRKMRRYVKRVERMMVNKEIFWEMGE